MKNFVIFFFLIFVSAFAANAQTTPQSCDCVPDTTGLNVYLATLTLNENAPLTIDVQSSASKFAVLYGVIDNTTPNVVQTFIDSYPNVTTLVFMQMPGSDDDTANLIAAQKIRDRGYITYLPAVNAFSDDAFIASGAVDMILAGTTRIIDVNGEVGVHAWSDGTNEATHFPVGDPVHQPYIDYYVSMEFSQADAEAFYYFTINAAPAAGIHLMTETELEQYKLRTCTFDANPSYTAILDNNTLTATLAGASYQWVDCDNGNAPVSGATNQTFTPISGISSYACNVTETNCTGTTPCYMIDNILPVTFLSPFRATPLEEGIEIIWTTAAEVNCAVFEIEKSKNGVRFETSSSANCTGFSLSNSYKILDREPFTGVNYYRIKQIDFDGTWTYSKIISVEYQPTSNDVFQVYPNPTTDFIHLNSNFNIQYLVVFDAVGQKKMEINTPQANLDISHLPNGTYYLHFFGNNQQESWSKLLKF